jgi:hypothetical protein
MIYHVRSVIDLAKALPVGPQIELLMNLRASVSKRRPVVFAGVTGGRGR